MEDRRAAKRKSLANDEWNLNKWILPEWRNRAVGSIKRREVKELLRRVKVNTPMGIQANRVRSLLSTIFNWAIEEEIIENSPAHRVKKLVKEKPRLLQLLPDQTRKVWVEVCSIGDERLRTFYQLAFLTCAREGEILGATWREFDPDARLWALPAERMKNGCAWTVPLPPAAVELLRERKERAGVAVTPDALALGTRLDKQTLNDYHHQFTARVGVDFRIHDWRSVALSRMEAEWGLPGIVRDRVLSHVRKGITDRNYNSYEYLNEHRVALARWQNWLNNIEEQPQPSNVIQLRPAAA